MMTTKLSDRMSIGEWWRSEWDVNWKVIAVGDTWADVKMAGGRSVHRVTAREVEDWERLADEADEVAAMQEP